MNMYKKIIYSVSIYSILFLLPVHEIEAAVSAVIEMPAALSTPSIKAAINSNPGVAQKTFGLRSKIRWSDLDKDGTVSTMGGTCVLLYKGMRDGVGPLHAFTVYKRDASGKLGLAGHALYKQSENQRTLKVIPGSFVAATADEIQTEKARLETKSLFFDEAELSTQLELPVDIQQEKVSKKRCICIRDGKYMLKTHVEILPTWQRTTDNV